MANTDRCLVIVGGVNGCGKSTFARRAANTDVLLGQTAINPDELTIAATAEAASKGFDLGASGANLVAVERAEKQVWKAIAEGTGVAIETVLSSSKFIAVVEAARRRQFRTRLVFVGLPTVEAAIERVAARVKLGGHGVPAAQIRDRWSRSHANLVAFARLVDDLLIFSNESAPVVLVAERVGRREPVRIIDRNALPAVTAALLGQP